MFSKLLLIGLFFLNLGSDKSPQEAYIDKYSAMAVEEMYRSGVPASITLAQGMLESRYGLSELAVKGKNHFGIKCHSDWTGKTMKVDDETKDECFRVYKDVSQSFSDHSDFLRYRQRYQFLFDYDVSDYEAWAYGLKKAGYATDPAYPQKLIRIIEEYDLRRFDKVDGTGARATAVADAGDADDKKDDSVIITRKKRKKPAKQAGKSLPPPPAELEAPEVMPDEVIGVSLTRKVYKINGVPFIYAEVGDTYAVLAGKYNLFTNEILRFNDADSNAELLPGDVVYIQNKKTQARKGIDKYVVEKDGEDLREICQRYAVKENSVLKMNEFAVGKVLKEGDTIKLRK